MKRLVILAAAVFTLASCAKTQVVYNEEPQEIAFKTVSGVMTKAPVTGTTFDQAMTVYAWKNETGYPNYFESIVFTKDGSIWKGTPSQFYPSTGSLNFVAYTDYDNITLDDPTSHHSYTYTLTDNTTYQNDFMVSSYIYNEDKDSGDVPILFTHALSLIEVNFKCTGTNVTIKEVELAGTKQVGNVTVTYDDTPTDDNLPVIGNWTSTGDPKNCNKVADPGMVITAGSDFVNFARFLVVPDSGATGKTLSITYDLNGNEITHPIDLTEAEAYTWEQGKKHIFNITFGIQEITFSPEVNDWTGEEVAEPTL